MEPRSFFCAIHVDLKPLSGKHCPIENFYMTLANDIKFFFSTFSIFFGQQFMRKFEYPYTASVCPAFSYKTFLIKSDVPSKPTIFSSFLSNDGRQAPQNPTPSHSPDFEKTPPGEHAAQRIASVACDALPRFPAYV